MLYSLASPGYVGLDQVLFEVPSGVIGNVPVQATMGTIRSNSVMIPFVSTNEKSPAPSYKGRALLSQFL